MPFGIFGPYEPRKVLATGRAKRDRRRNRAARSARRRNR